MLSKAEEKEALRKATRKPFQPIQPMANEAAKKAKERTKKQTNDATEETQNAVGASGVLDKIEQMLEEGKYRPDGGQSRKGYRVRRKVIFHHKDGVKILFV